MEIKQLINKNLRRNCSIMKYLYLLLLVVLASCNQTKPNSDKDEVADIDSNSKKVADTSKQQAELKDRTEKFLWREQQYDPQLKDTVNQIIINEALSKTLTAPERAALGFVVTFVGSDCDWDGRANDDYSNLKCKTLDALKLGYQCSDQHLGFLRQWFRNDSKSIEELKNCPTVPYTATSQSTFDYINWKVKDNLISVEFAAKGVNMRMGQSWSWTETDHFQYNKDQITLIKKDKSEVKRSNFSVGE